MPAVSICLLTYRRVDVLSRSIESLLAQSYTDFELIINDDNSPDETGRIAQRYVESDRRVRYFRNPKNLRYAGNQNAAVARAAGELVAIVHDGDVYRKDCIEKWVSALEANPSAGIVFNASDAINEHGEVVTRYRHPYVELIPGKEMVDDMLRLYSSPIFGIVMVRKNILLDAGSFDEKFPILNDVDMWMRLLLISDAAYINEPLFQIHPRENDHVNRGVNWKIIDEQHNIFMANVLRRFVDDPAGCARAKKRLSHRHRIRVARAGLWCLRHGQFKTAADGLSRLRSSSVK